MIEPGRVYLEHVLSPQEDAASGRWLRVAECAWHADAHKRSDLINARNST
jgi:hypothetical protein